MEPTRWGTIGLALVLLLAGCPSLPADAGERTPAVVTRTVVETRIVTPEGGLSGAQTPTTRAAPSQTATSVLSPSPTSTPRPPRNPWRSASIVVGINDSADRGHDHTGNIEDAIAYWEGAGARYRHYDGALVLDPDAADPDVEVRFVSRIDTCGPENESAERIAGCAPIMSRDSVPADPVVVRILAGRTDAATTATLEHEFGHILGLDHGEEPNAVMRESAPGDFRSRRNATDRAHPWRTTDLAVYVNGTETLDASAAEADEQVRRALTYYSAGADGWLARNVTLRLTENASEADVVVEFTDSPTVREGSIGEAWGQDTDVDEALEYYTFYHVRIKDVDPDHSGWHVGYWLGFALGADSTEDLPPPFDEPAADDRDDWWR